MKKLLAILLFAFACSAWAQAELDSSEVSLRSIRKMIPQSYEVEKLDGMTGYGVQAPDGAYFLLLLDEPRGIITFFATFPTGDISKNRLLKVVNDWNQSWIFGKAFAWTDDQEKLWVQLRENAPYDGGINRKNLTSYLAWFEATMASLKKKLNEEDALGF